MLFEIPETEGEPENRQPSEPIQPLVSQETTEEVAAAPQITRDPSAAVDQPQLPSLNPYENLTSEEMDFVVYGRKEDKGSRFETPQILAETVDPVRTQQVKEISENLGLEEYEVRALLSTKSPQQLAAVPKLAQIEKNYPGIAQWAQNPENYQLVEKEPGVFMALTDSLKSINRFTDDLLGVGVVNVISMDQLATHVAMANGLLDLEQGIEFLNRNQETLDQNPIKNYVEQNENIFKAMDKMSDTLETPWAIVGQMLPDEKARLSTKVAVTLAAMGYTGIELFNMTKAAVQNPQAAVLLSLSSAYSIGPSMVAAILGGLAGPFGAAGASSAAGFSVGYSQYLLEKAEDFRDEKTGKIDFRAMYSDPVIVQELRDKAAIYGGTHAAFDATSGFLLGRTVSKQIESVRRQATRLSAAKKVKMLGGALVAETAIQAGLEGAGETTAKIAVGENLADAVGEGVLEAVLAGPLVLLGVGFSSLNQSVRNSRRAKRIDGVVDAINKASTAASNYDTIKDIRDTLNRSNVAKQNPQQTQEFVKTVQEAEGMPPDLPPIPDDQSRSKSQEDAEIEINTKREEDIARGDETYTEVKFDIDEFEQFALGKEMSPVDLADALGPEFAQAYRQAKSNGDSSVGLTLDEYVRYSNNYPELDELLYLNGSEYNHLDALVTFQDADRFNVFDLLDDSDRQTETFKTLEENVKKMLASDESISIRPNEDMSNVNIDLDSVFRDFIEGETEFEFVEGDPEDGEPVLRPIQLLQVSRSRDERKVFKTVRSEYVTAIKRAKSPVSLETADVVAETAFRNMRFRARATGRPILDILEETRITAAQMDEGTAAFFSPGFAGGNPRGVIAFGPDTRISSVMHELGHSWLQNLGADWEYISNIPFEEMTPIQQDYYQAMLDMGEYLKAATFSADKFEYYLTKKFMLYPSPLQTGLEYYQRNAAKKDYISMEALALYKKSKALGNNAQIPIGVKIENVGDIFNAIKQEKFRDVLGYHEVFSQSTELYFAHNELADTKLKAVFARMKEWMSDLLNVAVSYPQYRPIGDFFPGMSESQRTSEAALRDGYKRAMDVILDASNKAADMTEAMFPPGMFDPAMLGANAKAYTEYLQKARDNAIANIYTKIFNQNVREREKLITAALDDIYDEAVVEYELSKSGNLERFIRDGGKDSRITADSLYREIFKPMYETEERAKVALAGFLSKMPRGIIAPGKKKGVDIQDIMIAYEIKTHEEALEILSGIRNKNEIISANAEAKIEKAFPPFKTDEEIHEIAVAAMNDGGRENILKIELQELAKNVKKLTGIGSKIALQAANQPKKYLDSLKEKAIKSVASMPLRKFKPQAFYKEVLKYNRKAAEFYGKGDIDYALSYKAKEALEHMKFQEAKRLEKPINKTFARIKHISRMTPQRASEYHNPDMFLFLKEVVAMFEDGKQIPRISRQKIPEILDVSTENFLNTLIDYYNSELISRGVTVEAFMALSNILEVANHVSVLANIVRIQGRETTLNKAVEQLLVDLSKAKKFKGLRMGQSVLSKYLASVISFRTFLTSNMTEKDYANSLWAELFNNVATDQAKVVLNKAQDEQLLKNAATAIAKKQPLMKDLALSIRNRAASIFVGSNEKPVTADALGHTFQGKSEVLKMLLYMGSESGYRKMALGGIQNPDGTVKLLGTIDPETGKVVSPELDSQIAQWIAQGVLTKEDFDFLQTVWDIFDKHYEPVKASVRRVYNRNMGKVEGRNFSTPFGDYRGGYVPLRFVNPTTLYGQDLESIAKDNSIFVHDFYPMVNTGMKEQRTEVLKPLSLSLNDITSDLNKVYMTAYLLPTMVDTGKILSDPRIKERFQQLLPGVNEDLITPWFKRVSAQRYSEVGDGPLGEIGDKAARIVRKRGRIMMFLGSWSTALVQELGQIQTWQVVPAKYLMRANAHVHFGNMGRIVKEVGARNPRMRARLDNNHRRMAADLEGMNIEGDAIARLDDLVEKMTYAPIHFMQTHVDLVVYHAASEYAMKELGLTDPQKIDSYATDVVERTQLSADIASRPDALMGSESKRLFTDLESVPIAMFGLLYEQYVRNGLSDTHSNRVKVFALATTLFKVSIAPAIVGILLRQFGKALSALGDEDELEDFMSDMTAQVAAETRSVVLPVVGRGLWALAGKPLATGGPPNLLELTPTLSRVSRPFSGVNRAIRKDSDMTLRDVKAILDMLTLTTGLPVSAGNHVIRLGEQIDLILD